MDLIFFFSIYVFFCDSLHFFNLSNLHCCRSPLFLLFVWQGALAHFTTLLSINSFMFLNPQSAWVFSACHVFLSYAVQYSLLWNTTQNELLLKFLSFAKGNKEAQKENLIIVVWKTSIFKTHPFCCSFPFKWWVLWNLKCPF